MAALHFDEARAAALEALGRWLTLWPATERVLLIRDLFGRFSLAVWAPLAPEATPLHESLSTACGPWWTGSLLDIRRADEVTQGLYAATFEQGRPTSEDLRLRILDRHRSRTGWFQQEEEPLWVAPDPHPPVIVYYSFKGGLGRSTVLAAFAIRRARHGERVCVVDLDLDSPGAGRLLAADADGLTAPRGVVDFLLEHRVFDVELSDYYHRCDRVAGAGEISVFPAGRIDADYPDKLARVDFDEASYGRAGGFERLLTRVRDELNPHWIAVDARTGISEPAGRLLSGIAHLHVLLGTTQEQSWQGLSVVLDRLGKERVEKGRAQAELAVVQAMVPTGEAGKLARELFRARCEQEFADRYYATEEDDSDSVWSLRDLDSQDAPHVPIAIDYNPKLADFTDIADIGDDLFREPYSSIDDRILASFRREVDE